MTALEIKDHVTNNFQEGQEINIKIKGVTRSSGITIHGKIERFYPNHVSVKHDGYYESFGYLEFMKIASKAKPVEIIIPQKFKVAAVG